jgi:iron(III) transport system ATP-binding protein
VDIAPILTLHDVTRRHGELEIVSQAGLQLHRGRITCLLGPSGCGKSTMLRMIAGLEPVDEGEILIHGETVSTPAFTVAPEKRGVGMVFQDNALFPHLNVSENVGFGLQALDAVTRQRRVRALLSRFHIEHLERAWPHTLSGGEQQRVAIARALARDPMLLLLDEPFSGLDGHLRAQIRRSMIADLREVGAAVLVVTHDPEEAMAIADDLILMAGGRILQTGDPADCYENPVSAAAARLLGDAIVLPAAVSGEVADTPFGPVPAPGFSDGAADMVVRPEEIILAREGIPATLLSARKFGREMVLELAIEEARFTVRTRGSALPEEPTVHLATDLTRARILRHGAPQ